AISHGNRKMVRDVTGCRFGGRIIRRREINRSPGRSGSPPAVRATSVVPCFASREWQPKRRLVQIRRNDFPRPTVERIAEIAAVNGEQAIRADFAFPCGIRAKLAQQKLKRDSSGIEAG